MSVSFMMRPRRAALPRLSDRLKLGTSSLHVSPFCIGISTPETVVEAFDAGINFFFLTADMHWPYYEGLRKGLSMLLDRGGGVRDDMVVAVVTYLSRPDQLTRPFHEVIEVVRGLERIDVCVVGWTVTEDGPERRAAIDAHRKEGTFGCRALGASYHHRQLVVPAVRQGAVDIGYIRYNADHPGAREDVFPHLGEHTTLIYGFKAMMSWVGPDDIAHITGLPDGTWCPTPTDAYRFALSPPEMDGILCAPQSPEQIRELADAMEEGPLEPEEEEHMIDLVALATGNARLATEADEGGLSR
jgi:aryl-alcohol dehydrogenase-like predicted oxidoreductase